MINLQDRLANLSPQKRALIEKKLGKMKAETVSNRCIPRRSGGGPAPLSFAQQRLWFLDQFDPGSSLYNIPNVLRLFGALNVDALRESLNELVRRHESMRTTFSRIDGEAVQVIHEPSTLDLDTIDLCALDEEDRQHEATRLQHEEAKRPFDLERGPLFRLSLIRIAHDSHILLLTMHHIISDGWSQGVLRRELRVLYDAFCLGLPSPLQELPIQYADYAAWQRNYMQGKVIAREVSYWTEHLAGAPTLLELPTDRPRPALQSFRGASKRISISSEVMQGLKVVSRQEGATLFMTLLAAFDVLLSRYSGQKDLVVGTPIANRTQAQTEGLIGFFVNTLPLRTDLSGEPGFRELLRRVREVALGAYAHQDLPFEKLVEELQPERSTSHSPIFQVMFTLQEVSSSSLVLEGLRIQSVGDQRVSAKFDLSFTLTESNGKLYGALEYSTDLFDDDRMERLLGHYQKLLEGIVANPDERISRLPFLTESEHDQLLLEWNDTQTDLPSRLCLHQRIEDQVDRTPNAIALCFENETLTYSQLDKRANQLAHYLRKHRVGPDVLVGLCVERSIVMVIGLLGILKAGGAYVPLDPSYPAERLEHMREDAGMSVVLTQKTLVSTLPPWDGTLLCLDTDWPAISQYSDERPLSCVDPDNLAYVLYTSGSTGEPKGVAIEHHSPVALVCWALSQLTIQELSGVVFATSICFDLSVYELFVTLCGGGRVLLVENALAIGSLGEELSPSLINTVPSAMAELLRQGAVPSTVMRVNLAGEPLTASLVDAIYDQTDVLKVYDLYGPSEDTTYSTYALREHGGPVTIGRPIANTQTYVLNRNLCPVPLGVSGELYIGGAGLGRGYLNRPDLTAERFVPDPFSGESGARLYRTGDLVRYRSDSNLEYLGRLDHQVKIRGFRIELGEIESALLGHMDVQEATVLAREDVPGEKRLVAYVVGKINALSVSQLQEYLHNRLPAYMVPSAFVEMEQLPLTPNGKVDRNALQAPDASGLREDAYVAPRTPIEEGLAKIWCEVLHLEQVGIHDNFFHLGGHSLLAVRLVSEIRRLFGQKLPLQMLFQSATIASIARELSPEYETTCWANVHTVTPSKPGTDRAPMFCMAAAQANSLGYVALGRHLGEDQPLFVLQSHYRSNTDRPYTTDELRDLGAVHIRAMRDLQPEGPYCLGGMCEGAHIAFEMARQLQMEGVEVLLLVSFDAWPEENTRTRLGWWLTGVSTVFARRKKDPTIRMKWIVKQIARLTVRSVRQFCMLLLKTQRDDSWEARYWPGGSFVPPKFDGKMTVFRVARQQPYRPKRRDLGWADWTTQGVEIYEVPGEHSTLLREPHVKACADILADLLKRAHDPLPTLDSATNSCAVVNVEVGDPFRELYVSAK